jgi:hypothetical protein
VSTLHYRPATTGGWLLIASGSRTLVVDRTTGADDSFADLTLEALRTPGAVQAVLDMLTRAGLANTPPFALAEWDSQGAEVRLIVRGSIGVSVSAGGATHEVSGVGVSTWTERVLADVTGLEFTGTPGARQTASTPADVSLPLAEGAVIAEGFSVVISTPSGKLVQPAPPAAKPAVVELADPELTVVELPSGPEEVAPEEVAPEEAAPEALEPETGITAPEVPETAEEPSSEASGYDYLFGATMYRSVTDAAVHVAEPADVDEPAPAVTVEDGPAGEDSAEDDSIEEDSIGDHDGETVLTSDIAKLRAERRASGKATAESSVTPEIVEAPAATVSLVLPSGSRELLDRKILIGRAPSVSKVSGGDMPRFITLGGGDQDISRNHAQVMLEGDTVVVTDLHSRNGTLVVLPGKSPQKLRAGEPTAVIIGTVIDFGGGITLTVERD